MKRLSTRIKDRADLEAWSLILGVDTCIALAWLALRAWSPVAGWVLAPFVGWFICATIRDIFTVRALLRTNEEARRCTDCGAQASPESVSLSCADHRWGAKCSDCGKKYDRFQTSNVAICEECMTRRGRDLGFIPGDA